MAASKLYYELGTPSAFSSLKHLTAAVGKQQSTNKKKKQQPSEIKAWLKLRIHSIGHCVSVSHAIHTQ
jgi:hypothetical protein